MRQESKLLYQKVVWMFRFVKPYQSLWMFGILFDIIGDGLGMIFSALALEYIADAILALDFKGVANGVIYFVISYLVMMIFHVLFYLTYGRAKAGIKAGLSGAVFYKLLKGTIPSEEQVKLEDEITYLNQDVELCLRMYTEDFRTLMKAVMMGIIALGSILARNLAVGFLCIVIFLGNILGNLYFRPKQEQVVSKRQKAVARLNGVYNEAFAGAMVIKLMQLKPMMLQRIKDAVDRVSDVKLEERRLTLKQESCTNLFLYTTTILPLIVNAVLWFLGRISFGTIFFIRQMTDIYLWYCNSIGIAIRNLSKCQAGIQRIYEMLQEKDEIEAYGSLVTRNNAETILELQNVKISYGDQSVIQDFSLLVKPNETIALVGSSGSGKSTLMKAILQLVPYEGNMKLYGVKAKDYSLEYLRNQFSYVEQEARLFDGTIYDNIVYGNVTATEDEVTLAAQKAYAHEFILKLPNGYDTMIGENGYKLSGGERQRIAIARAFLKNAPILLLDEATSALDSESEQKVQMAIEELMKGRTILVVAHRLSTIQHANRILVLEHGTMIESGKHEELIQHGGRYQELYQLQFMS